VKGAAGPKGIGPPLAAAKTLGMATYFAFDHIVWAYSTGLIKDQKNKETIQKVSWYGWLLGSLCSVITEVRQKNQ